MINNTGRSRVSRTTLILSLVVGGAITSLSMAATPPVSAQVAPASTTVPTTVETDSSRADPELLRISAVSPWVAPDGVFQVRFAVDPSVPLNSTITWTVHQRLVAGRVTTLRQRVDRALHDCALEAEPRGAASTRFR